MILSALRTWEIHYPPKKNLSGKDLWLQSLERKKKKLQRLKEISSKISGISEQIENLFEKR